MHTLTPMPIDSRRLCVCGRIASFYLTARVGPKGRPWRWCICTPCAALETGLSVYELLAILTRPALAERVQP